MKRTMPIRHHLSDKIMMGYAAGLLPEAFNLIVASHVSMCDDCRAALAAFDALGGAVLDSESVEPLSDHALEEAMAKITTVPQATARSRSRRQGILPTPLADYVGDLDRVRWSSLGKGAKQAILPTDKFASARLLYIPSGVAMPDHGHRGLEMTLVLQGAFADDSDYFGPGDVEIADQDTEHSPVAQAGADCICLAASDAPLRFRGMIPRLVQPLFRI
jgi:putative transcriptional regulator